MVSTSSQIPLGKIAFEFSFGHVEVTQSASFRIELMGFQANASGSTQASICSQVRVKAQKDEEFQYEPFHVFDVCFERETFSFSKDHWVSAESAKQLQFISFCVCAPQSKEYLCFHT